MMGHMDKRMRRATLAALLVALAIVLAFALVRRAGGQEDAPMTPHEALAAAPEEPHIRRTIPEAVVTRYTSVETCTADRCVMANGKRAARGYAACPRAIAFGTFVRIEGETYECGDRTALRFDGRFDIFEGYGDEAHAAALQAGIDTLPVAVLR